MSGARTRRAFTLMELTVSLAISAPCARPISSPSVGSYPSSTWLSVPSPCVAVSSRVRSPISPREGARNSRRVLSPS